jgi:type I restriction enzyme M protein
MIGAIIGDIAGSVYEFDNIHTKDFVLFADHHGNSCRFTDDTVMTCAVAKALLDCEDPETLPEVTVKTMREVGQPYPDCGYGGRFYRWMYSENPKPYGSFGNGAAMRVSPVGFLADSLEEALDLARKVTAVTHNHPEGIKGAEATAAVIFLARTGRSKEQIRAYVREHYYPLNETVDEIRLHYVHNETCQETVPQAIQCFLEGEDFVDVIRNCISLGGDSDTLAAIAGAMAEAFFGVPDELRDKALEYLDEDLTDIFWEFTIRLIEKAAEAEAKEEKEEEVNSEALRDGTLLLDVKREFAENPSEESFARLCAALALSCVTVPGSFEADEADMEQLRHAKVDVTYTLMGNLRFRPDILRDKEGHFYLPVFSNKGQMPEEYASQFSSITVTAREAARMAAGPKGLQGLVLDPFTAPVEIPFSVAEQIKSLADKLNENE